MDGKEPRRSRDDDQPRAAGAVVAPRSFGSLGKEGKGDAPLGVPSLAGWTAGRLAYRHNRSKIHVFNGLQDFLWDRPLIGGS
jgi:hypothetical protein